MEDLDILLNQQNELGKLIEKFIINAGKEPIARRTLEYYEKKLQTIRDLLSQFVDNHENIKECTAGDVSHKYFTSAYFTQVQEGSEHLIQSFLTNITRLRAAPSQQKDIADELQASAPKDPCEIKKTSSNIAGMFNVSINNLPDMEEHDAILQRMTRRRNSTMKLLEHLLGQTNARIAEPHSKQYFELQIKNINSYWSTITELNLSIWELVGHDSQHVEYTMQDYYNLEELVHQTVLKLSESQASIPISHNQQTQLKLPKIMIPTFDGDYLKWPQFYDIYTQMIHNTAISDSDKMFYLNSNLIGEAKALVQHLPISNANYVSAWKILTHRYNNKRILITSLLNKLLSQPKSQSESSTAIRSLHDVTTECTLGLKNLGMAIESWDAILLHLLVSKLDKITHSLYEQSLKQPNEPQTLKDFLEFLELRFQSLDALVYNGHQQADKTISIKYQKTNNSKFSFTASTQLQNICKMCQQQHPIYYCPKFLQMTPHIRLKKLKETNLCINCLKDGHFSSDCASRRCKDCDKKHNTLVHGAFDNGIVNRRSQTSGNSRTSGNLQASGSSQASAIAQPSSSLHIPRTSSNSQSANNKAIVGFGVQKNCHIFLATAIIHAVDIYGRPIECRALLDSGSQVNLITKSLCKRLGLGFSDSNVNVTGIGGSKQSIQKRATVNIKSRTSSYTRMVEVFVLDNIIDDQPNYNINLKDFDIPQNIQLADPRFCERQRVDILIGAEFYSELMMIGQISPNKTVPTMQNTVFGWVVLGKAANIRASSQYCGINTLDEQLQRFWELDEMASADTNHTMSTMEKKCEQFFNDTTSRTSSGEFVVRLPFKMDVSVLGSSQEIAKRRFLALERKLSKNKQLQQDYVKFMTEYEELGHMELADVQHIKEPNYFIPHHCVLKLSSTTTKLRVVFDASCKTSTNVSLNQLLHTGPKIQQELFDVLIRFRQYKYVFTSDIEKMYRQIKMHEQDCDFQLIYWRPDPQHKLNVYRLKTITYGTTPAPYMAMKCLQSIGLEMAKEYPLAAQMIQRNFYVDDLMAGSDSVKQAARMQSQVINALRSAGFRLRKWCSNHQLLLQNIPPEDIEHSLDIIKESEEGIKTLGITWEPNSDVIIIKTAWNEPKRITKRTILSDVAHIFDPIGLVSPVVIIAKIFVQELWKQKLDWDAALPMHLHTKWVTFRHSLKHLDKVILPRHVRSSTKCIDSQLHVFSDASERAFGAAIYIRSTDEHKNIEVKLLCSKSRVAPSKILTIPKLELQAAKLAAELCHRIKNIIEFHDIDIHFWTDSQIVLHWINSESSSFKTFVANRISYIQRHSAPSQWRHVSSGENPADYISRGILPECLQGTKSWFHGPQFLKYPPSQWPKRFELKEEINEERKCVKSVLTTVKAVDNFVFQINHRNSFSFLVRTTAYIMRFKAIMLDRIPKKNFLLMSEIHEAFTMIIKSLQALYFQDEIRILARNCGLEKKNRLSLLTPFIDSKGLLRVGGRIEAANISYDAKHPMVLPSDHIFTQLIMEEIHIQLHHIGPQTLLAITRQRFWPLNGKRIANKIVHKCLQCFKAKPVPMVQLMGNLPTARVQSSRPFLNTGVDFAGPIWTHFKIRGKRPQKSYIAVFCCFATKAIHLEIVSDLSADGFIGALRRFWSRRGRCKTIFSDNATNFVGGSNQLQELYEMFNNRQSAKRIHSECIGKGIEFQFIPPRAPHFGGLWESAVKSTKNLLFRTMKTASLTYEELCTLTAEIEAILNSRPLTPVSSDANDLEALTPAHFLIGEQLTAIPDPVVETRNVDYITRWKLVSYIKNEFWRRWQTEYISSLQQRYKWRTKCQNTVPGLMVLLKEDNVPPTQWRLGRIEKTFMGHDGLIRVVDVRTSNGTLRRPIHKLCPLPVQDDQDNEESSEKNEHIAHTVKSEQPKRTRKISINALSAVLLVLLMLPAYITATKEPAIEITNFESHPGIYFESLGLTNLINNEWHLVVYYDMQTYWEELLGFENGVKRLNQLCSSIRNATYCESILSLFEQNLSDIRVYNEVLLNSNVSSSRYKRGAFDIIGTVANRLFGVLDVEYAEKMADTIKTVDKNERSLFNLLNNHTIILEATANIIKKTQEQVNQQFVIFDKSIDDIQQKIGKLDNFFDQQQMLHMFSSLAVRTLLIMSNYQRIQASLIDILTDSHHGKINPLLLTPIQLKTALLTIRDNLSPALKLPFLESSQIELSNIYNLLHVQGRLSRDHLIFRVQLPLASNHQFETFRMIPIPVQVGQEYRTIKPSSSFLVVSLHRDLFYPMSEAEAMACIKTIANMLLCKQSQPLYNRNSKLSQCEIALLNHQPVQPTCNVQTTSQAQEWIQLYNPNNWIFSLSKPTIINIVCQYEFTSATLHGMGLLKILKNCVLKQDTLTLTSHNVHPTQLRSSFTPTMNFNKFLDDINDTESQHQINHETQRVPLDEINRIQEQIQAVKSMKADPEQLSSHDVHQYMISYLGLTVGIIIAVLIIWAEVKSKFQVKQRKAPVPMPRSHAPVSEPDFTFSIDEQSSV